jgi:hypothetical protein
MNMGVSDMDLFLGVETRHNDYRIQGRALEFAELGMAVEMEYALTEKDRSEDYGTYLEAALHHDLGQSQSKVAYTTEQAVRLMGLFCPLYLVDRCVEEGQEDVESRDEIHAEDLNLVCIDQDRIAPALKGVDDYLITDTTEAQVFEMETHVGIKQQEEEVEEVPEVAEYSTIRAGEAFLVAHCQSLPSADQCKTAVSN